jgi:hypothetical protein
MTNNQTQILRQMLVAVEANNAGNKTRKIDLPFATEDYTTGQMLAKGHEVRLWQGVSGELRVYDASTPFRKGRKNARKGTAPATPEQAAPEQAAPSAPRSATKADMAATIADLEAKLAEKRAMPTVPSGASDTLDTSDDASVKSIIEAAHANNAQAVTVAIVRF